jgi:pimeloyl-ACP methyl ester carboxylesterase
MSRNPPAAAGRVVLVHGLWMNSLALVPMHAHLARRGFRVTRFGYASVKRVPDHNSQRLARLVESLPDDPIHLVGHSMGGVMILQVLKKWSDPRVRRVVLLGSPVTGSRAGRDLSRSAGGRWMLGRSLPLWSDTQTPQAPPGVEIGVIAGDVPLGLARLFARLPKPNDGVVAVEETRVDGAADALVMRVNHTGMILSPAVAGQVCAFLKEGRFARG